jgi:hypothetical protein
MVSAISGQLFEVIKQRRGGPEQLYGAIRRCRPALSEGPKISAIYSYFVPPKDLLIYISYLEFGLSADIGK